MDIQYTADRGSLMQAPSAKAVSGEKKLFMIHILNVNIYIHNKLLTDHDLTAVTPESYSL